jgi:small subunit ribosomal protein S2
MKSLLEAGVHFGHRTRRWNPKMKPYIFTERNGIHIIDLQQTIARLNQAYDLIKDTVASGGIVLFVGTKRQAQESVAQEASRCYMPYVDQRWLGGTLTNWRTIRQRIDYLVDAEKQKARGEFARLVKKEALMREREIERLNHRLGGLKEMRRLPNLLFIVDVRRDALAVKEANILGIPIIALVDTNCDPDPIDHIIPSNDDAIRAIKLMLTTMASAALDGQAILHTLEAEKEEAAEMEGEETMERYLGPSTLAKLQAEAEAAQMADGEDDEVDSEEDEIEVETATADEIEADVTTADEQTEEDKAAEVETPEAVSVEAEASTAEEEASPEVVTDTENSDEEIVTTETAKEIESEKI